MQFLLPVFLWIAFIYCTLCMSDVAMMKITHRKKGSKSTHSECKKMIIARFFWLFRWMNFANFFTYPSQHFFFEIIKKEEKQQHKNIFLCIRNYFLIHEASKIVQHTEHEFHQISLYCIFFAVRTNEKLFLLPSTFFHSFIHNYIQLQINDLFIFLCCVPRWPALLFHSIIIFI